MQNSIFLLANWIILDSELVDARMDLANAWQFPSFLWEPTIARSFVFIGMIKPLFTKILNGINWWLGGCAEKRALNLHLLV
jgi:hypothetical protein